MNSPIKCPCGSEQVFSSCCLPIIRGKKQPGTAEALLRARYTAFTQGEVDFILSSHHSRTRGEVKREEIESWSRGSEWLGLRVLEVQSGGEKDQQGIVSFVAQYKTDGKATEHRENALFEREDGNWRFLDAQAGKTAPIRRSEPKVGRNEPCGCGSGKKFKKCCGT